MSPTFCLTDLELPTQYNVAKYLQKRDYNSTDRVDEADFSDRHLTLTGFKTQLLEYKHHLTQLVQEMSVPLMPVSYIIDDHNYPEIIRSIAQHDPTAVWILKPAFMNNGEGIHIVTHLDQLRAHYQSTNRYGGPHVLQRYITHPHLLQGHKYTLRLFVVLTSEGQAYAYKDGYFNICCQQYTPNDWQDLTPHLTNEHLGEDDVPNIYQMPTSQCPNFDTIDRTMKRMAGYVTQAFYQKSDHDGHHNERSFTLFGFDYIVDDQLNVWLLEVNHGPWFPKEDDHPLQAYLYDYLWQHLVTDFVEPIMYKQPFACQSGCFDPVQTFL